MKHPLQWLRTFLFLIWESLRHTIPLLSPAEFAFQLGNATHERLRQ